ncbi:hypothetical protein ABZY19_37260 [Streptomyces sp. NPDC006475]|uniref:Uncharacterized protein n=1 Tax=Streptomyces achmelvichensis TaxID=3134111 RepID=A0ACC6PWG8_9ACTN
MIDETRTAPEVRSVHEPELSAPQADAAVPPEAPEADAAVPPEAQAPAAPLAPPAPAVPPALATPGRRRRLRTVLRWTAATVVFAALGTGVAYGITEQERTDVPGLATEDDGRWVYPKLAKPVLPAGAVDPFDRTNEGQVHYADLSALLLPLPAGARPDKQLKGGRVPAGRFLAEFPGHQREDLEQDLTDGGLRHVVARGWTMADSTSTRIYLLRFHSVAFADAFFSAHLGGEPEAVAALNGVDQVAPVDESYPSTTAGVPSTDRHVYGESEPGAVHVRHAYITAGDTVALIVQSRKGTSAAVPFHQTVVLQNQLLG